MGLTDDDVREILRIIDESPLEELRIETEGFSLYVRRDGTAAPQEATKPAPPDPTKPAPPNPTKPAPPTARGDLLTIEAPTLGTFYLAEGPGQPAFVEVGSQVEPDTTVCIIEVMKMMNSVPAGVAGTIAEVCQENGAFVEEAQPLFRVQPA